MIRNIRYYITESFKSIFTNILMSLASVTTVAMCLLLFGAFMLFHINLSFISEQIRAQVEVQAFIDMEYSEAQGKAIQMQVSRIDNVKAVDFETKYQAFQNYKTMLGDNQDALIGLEDEDFLPHSIKITFTDLNLVEETIKTISQIAGIEKIVNRQETMDKLISATDFIRLFSLYSMLMFSVIAIFIISNTIKLTVHARQREIHIMKYVGATDWFIRWPFLIEGVMVGVSGAILSFLLITLGYEGIIGATSHYFENVIEFRNYSEISMIMCVALFLFGTIMGSSGSIIAIRRHLKV